MMMLLSYIHVKSKVEVMLYKWGLADELKLQVVSSSLQSSTAGMNEWIDP